VQAITPPVESAGTRTQSATRAFLWRSGIPIPFHGSANLERFPRTSESVLGERDASERDPRRAGVDSIVDQFMRLHPP
jgi:hypothetical protein